MQRPRTGVDRTAPRVALGASVASFVFVALVAATPGSPFTPILPPNPGARSAGSPSSSGSTVYAGPRSPRSAWWPCRRRRSRSCSCSASAGAGRSRRGRRSVDGRYHVALLFLPFLFSRDVYSYAYYGRIAATYHANPYLATPADFPHDVLATFVGPKWVDTPAVYGALWTQASALVTRATDDVGTVVSTFRVIAIAASLATVFVVAGLVHRVRPEREAFAVALVGLNPVVLFQSAASGHNDLLVALTVAAALALVFSGRELWATAALALGTLDQGDGRGAAPGVVGRGRGPATEGRTRPDPRSPCGARGGARAIRGGAVREYRRSDARRGRTRFARGLARAVEVLQPGRRRGLGRRARDRAADRVRAHGGGRGVPGREGRLAPATRSRLGARRRVVGVGAVT